MEPLLTIDQLTVDFNSSSGRIPIIKGIDLELYPGEIIGLVGESGSGKSVTARSIVRLNDERDLTAYGGAICYRGENVLDYSQDTLRAFRRHQAAMIFQDPMSSLNPLMTIGKQLIEAIKQVDASMETSRAQSKAVQLMEDCGLKRPVELLAAFPYELSGGMQQRIMIAMALAKEPALLIADEATTALDVTIQAQILNLCRRIQKERQTAIIFITHDLTVAQDLCDRIAVMRDGYLLEVAPTKQLFTHPLHPYTSQLFSAIPGLKDNQRQRIKEQREEAKDYLAQRDWNAFDTKHHNDGTMITVESEHLVMVQQKGGDKL